ncbi:MAG: deoxyribodipyrimidine photo-lyase [Gammaproteobacteria bacterium]|nr:deoxyribodipyrimidine photo-lyase [Gammaproteobacteria bacterium]MBP9728881.1 deoxyribodipyrimidine photo-lyase [Gammaproteobacteria bacterium]
MKKTLVWFRQDLRLVDNPALHAALEQGSILAIYILEEKKQDYFSMGSASRWWLHHSLSKLHQSLNNQLNVYIGNAQTIILKLIEAYKIEAVYWNRCYEPWRISEDTSIKSCLKKINIDCKSFNASLLFEPWEILKSDGMPYKVFTPFYQRGCLNAPSPRTPLGKPKKLDCIVDRCNTLSIETLNLLPTIPWHESLEAHWTVGEKAAHKRFKDFLQKGLNHYQEGRNFPARSNVSRLSPHLHFGEISPHVLWHTAQMEKMNAKTPLHDIEHFVRQLVWREFSYYLLYHFPELPYKNFQRKFDRFPWQNDTSLLKSWQKGQTGYPIVDAGMRELWQTGTMHNRVRMIVGSFLVKNLNLDWRHGAAWFWDCLVDADLANNSAGWQWIAGSGADAAPYFRIFNPITQGEKFDLEGIYTKRFVPELAKLPIKYLFEPWSAPSTVLKEAGIILGETYPKPIVDLQRSRKSALEAFASLRES